MRGFVFFEDRYDNIACKLQTMQGGYVLRYLHTDPLGRLPGETAAPQPAPPGNQMIGMTYPDGSGVRIVRDAQARPTELRVLLANGQTQTLLSGATYYPFGPASRWAFGNGRVLRRSLNDNYQPEAVEDTASGGISEGYGFNEVGNLATLRHAGPLDPPRRSYTYDGMNRLTHVREGANGALLQAYDYDATGNRTARTDGITTTSYSYSGSSMGPGPAPSPARHYLRSVGAQARGYDDAGNTTRIGTATGGGGDLPPGGAPMPEPPVTASAFFSASSVPAVREFDYDDANRMHAVRHDGVVAMRYLYNAMGERVHRAGSGIAVATLYDEDGKWIGDYDANGQPIQQVVWLDDLPVGLLVGAGANQKLYYIEADALGTPRVVIDPTRNVAVWRWNLVDEAFGDSAPNQDVDGDGTAFVFDMRFPGQRYDSATGLNYNYFRDYDPGTGRYAQSDPIGLDGGMSTYGYANGSPLVYSDPEGLAAAFILRMGIRYFAPRLAARAAMRKAQLQAMRNAQGRKFAKNIKQPNRAPIACKTIFGVSKGEAGRFSSLAARGVKGDKLTPHHMPQVAASYTSRAEGGALVMPEAQHVMTRTYGYKGAITARQEAGMAFRDVLARDVRDVRNIAGSEYNQGLRSLLNYYRANFPGLMSKI